MDLPVNLVDLAVIAIAVVAAILGWRSGAIPQVLGLAGAAVGIAAGASAGWPSTALLNVRGLPAALPPQPAASSAAMTRRLPNPMATRVPASFWTLR